MILIQWASTESLGDTTGERDSPMSDRIQEGVSSIVFCRVSMVLPNQANRLPDVRHSWRLAMKPILRLAMTTVPDIVDLSLLKRNASIDRLVLARSISSFA